MHFYVFQPISEWTSAQVLEWMAATNLYLCSEIFRYKDIKGSDLVHLDKEKLIVSTTNLSNKRKLKRLKNLTPKPLTRPKILIYLAL